MYCRRKITYFWEVLTGVRSTSLLPRGSRYNGLNCILHDIAKLQSFDKVTAGTKSQYLPGSLIEHSRVPDHAPILDSNLIIAIVYTSHFLHSFIQRFLRPAWYVRNFVDLPKTSGVTETLLHHFAWPSACSTGFQQ